MEELIAVDHPRPNQCESLGNPKRLSMGPPGPASPCGFYCVITSAGLCWNGEAQVDGRKFISDVTLFQWARLKPRNQAESVLTKSVDPRLGGYDQAHVSNDRGIIIFDIWCLTCTLDDGIEYRITREYGVKTEYGIIRAYGIARGGGITRGYRITK